MSSLFLSLLIVIGLYFVCIVLFMKKRIAWRYKALIYGFFTFLMLVGVFLIFGHYDRSWKKGYDIPEPAPPEVVNNDRG